MPFTAAHPAAAIPLIRPLGRYASASALVIGSIVPDVAYFLPWKTLGRDGHTVGGLFTFCLPAGIVLYYSFHAAIAPLLADLAPKSLRVRLPDAWIGGDLPACPISLVAVSVLIGAATHLIWDSFTHSHGWAIQALPALTTPLLTWQGYTVFVYKVLQHGSTIFGMSLLFWWFVRWMHVAQPQMREPSPSATVRNLLLSAILVPTVTVAIVSALSVHTSDLRCLSKLRVLLGSAIFSSGTVLLASTLLVGFLWRLARTRAG